MLDELKIMLGITDVDADRDAKLQLILSNATKRLKRMLGGIEPPDELQDIIVEVAVIRFNRIGSEGLSSHSVEGESLTFSSDDFDSYKGDIQDWLNSQKDISRGKVRFL